MSRPGELSNELVPVDLLEATIATALQAGGEFAEVFVEHRRSLALVFDDGRVEDVVSGVDRGAGVRVISGATTGFAHTSDLSAAGLAAAAAAASAAARGSAGIHAAALTSQAGSAVQPVERDPEEVDTAAKVELLRRADDAARAAGSAISQVNVSYNDAWRRFQVANSDGVYGTDRVCRTRFMVNAVARGDTGLQTGFEAPGRTVGFEFFDEFDVEEVARTSALRALRLLDARPAPSGQLPVVLAKGAGGVLFHEACGHGLEADLVDKDASVFAGRVGQRVASPAVTLVDDGTLAREWGTGAIDDEGRPRACTTLIRDGELVDFMWDARTARQHSRSSTSNGRRQSYAHLPMARMTNTYLLPGTDDPESLIADTELGVYCVQMGGGSVNTATGDFVFGMTEAYLIENGRLTAPLRPANLIGNGPAVLHLIDAVANDLATWTGTCRKDGQNVAVSAGQPTVRVSALTIGGTAGG